MDILTRLIPRQAWYGNVFRLNCGDSGLKIGQEMDVQPMVTLALPITAGPPITPICQATVVTFDDRTETYQTAPVQMPAVHERLNLTATRTKPK
jgi:hypothetical protein